MNHTATEYIGEDRFRSIVENHANLTREIGFRLPHPDCVFLHRYVGPSTTANPRVTEYFFLGLAKDDSTITTVSWFSWSRQDGWKPLMTQAWRGPGDTFDQREAFQFNTDPPSAIRDLLPGTMIAVTRGSLYLIYERGGAVLAHERPPAPTRSQTGRMRVHPLAPSSVSTIKVNDPRLLRATEPPPQPPISELPTQPTESPEPIKRNPARGTTVHYKHPRYKNMQGKTGHRRAQRGHPDYDKPPPSPTYKAVDDD